MRVFSQQHVQPQLNMYKLFIIHFCTCLITTLYKKKIPILTTCSHDL